MAQKFVLQFPYLHNQMWNTLNAMEALKPLPTPPQPWYQGWHGPYYDGMATFPYPTTQTFPSLLP
jgi:hypothetical protein